MRILQVHARYNQPGGEEATVATERALLESAGHLVDQLIVPNEGVPGWRLALNCFGSSQAYRKVADAIMTRYVSADIIHLHNTAWSLGPSAIRAAHNCGKPIMLTCHNYRLACPAGTLWRGGKICVECVGKTAWPFSSTTAAWPSVQHGCYRDSRLATLPIAAGTALHRWRGTYDMIDVLAPVSGYVQEVLHNAGFPMPLPLHPPAVYPEPEAQIEPPTLPSFLFVGRLSEEKGVRTLLEAWRRMAKEMTTLTIVGDGPLADEVENALCRNISWLRQLPHADVLDYMRRATAVIVPSVWPDPAPRVAIEALACGTPTITSDAGGLPELQPTAKFPAGDVDRLIQIVGIMARCPAPEMRELRAQARNRYEQHFGARAALVRLERLYQRAIEIHTGRARLAAAE